MGEEGDRLSYMQTSVTTSPIVEGTVAGSNQTGKVQDVSPPPLSKRKGGLKSFYIAGAVVKGTRANV